MKKLIFICTLILVCFSCKKNEEAVELGYKYFPTTEGLYQVYDVMEIFHDHPSLVHDTTKYQLKTKIGELYTDLEGEEAHVFYRYKRDSSHQEWNLTDVWSMKRDNFRGEIVDENHRVIKLVFPTNDESSWNINAQNDLDPLIGTIENAHKENTANDFSYEASVTVRYAFSNNLIDDIDSYEVYAENIGLVHLHNKNLSKVFGTAQVNKGEETHYDLVQHGVE
jgi:hypothetical protein